MSDGNFSKADGEIANIRSAISEILKDNSVVIPISKSFLIILLRCLIRFYSSTL